MNSNLDNNFQLGWPRNVSSVWWKYLRFYILHFFHIKKQALFPRSLLKETESCLIKAWWLCHTLCESFQIIQSWFQSGRPPHQMKVGSLIWGIFCLRVYARLGDTFLQKISLTSVHLVLASTSSLNGHVQKYFEPKALSFIGIIFINFFSMPQNSFKTD